MLHTPSVSVALDIQHAKRMRRIILSFVDCLAVLYSSTLSHKRHDYRGKKFIEHKTCVSIFSTTFSDTLLILRRIQRAIIINVRSFSRKLPVILVRF